jgi:VanZ family protein
MKFYFPALFCAILILWLSVSSIGIQLPESLVSPDKLGHLLAYGLLNMLLNWALMKSGKYSPKSATLAVLSVTIYGVALEFVQWAFFPNRFFEIWDMVANFSGALLAFFVSKLFFTK